MAKTLSRRRLLIRAVQLPALGLMLTAAGTWAAPGDFSCDNEKNLSAADRKQRTSQHYVDTSPHGAAKNCDNCSLFQPADDEGHCGACLILPGPIHRLGYCDAWTDIS
jgi:hypothetical protein